MTTRHTSTAPVTRLPTAAVREVAHITFDGLGKIYTGASSAALQDVSFAVQRAESFGIIGRSGAGKSTLLRTINALELPSSGHVKVDGIDVATLDEDALVGLRCRIGMIFQHFNLLSAKTVFENVALPLRVASVPKAQIAPRVNELLSLVGLSGKADAYPAMLSGGQKQRVGIARALVHRPEILLCDEATSALDPETTDAILTLLGDVQREFGLTVVLITHDMGVIHQACDRVLVLDQGRIAELGPVDEVFANPQAEATRALLRPLQHAWQGRLAASETRAQAQIHAL